MLEKRTHNLAKKWWLPLSHKEQR